MAIYEVNYLVFEGEGKKNEIYWLKFDGSLSAIIKDGDRLDKF